MRRLTLKKTVFTGVSALLLSFAAYQIFSIRNAVRQTLADERARLSEQNRVAFKRKILTPHLTNKIRILQNTDDVRDFLRFKDSYFAATSGGLVQFDEGGKIEKHFTVSDGLPESDLTALAVFQNKLYIGTRSKNLLSFDGEKFENYVFTDRQTQAVTAFLESNGKLLIGTFAGGLIEFDGENFTEIKPEKQRITAINSLFKSGANLYVGTFAGGLLICENGIWSHFTKNEGLPSNRVVGVAFKDKNLYAATDFGLAVREGKRFRTLAVLPSLSSLINRENKLFLTKDDGAIFTFDTQLKEFAPPRETSRARFVETDEKIFLLSESGIFQFEGARAKTFARAENESLTDNFVSAIARDKSANLWVGTFRRGIDVFSPDGKKLKHIESEKVREINFLQMQNERVAAASSAGLIEFKTDFFHEITTKKEGLPSDSITHFAGDFTATARGLAFREGEKIRVISAINGLPNNSVYAVLENGEKLYAGTLGGLAEIHSRRVVRVWKDSNSNLTTNWVTALIRTNERIFIGTYGGGVFELLPSGKIHSFEAEAGKFVVNPNAFFADGERLYIGTLDGAKILNLQTQKWTTLKSPLPSETVMSVTGDDENIYFGTTNGIARIEKSYFGEIE
mgnify:CR=1 FL=1